MGIITRTPAGDEKHYLVRMPDGFEVSLSHDEFESLKSYKSRLTGKEINEEEFNLNSTIIYQCVVGSKAFGLDNDESDTDRRGIFIAPASMYLSLFGSPEQFEDSQGQSCHWELKKFLNMALRANPNILECLYSPLVEKCTSLGEELLSIKHVFLSKMIFQTFNGYALSQFKKIEQDRKNNGEVRWKHAMHLIRLLLSGAIALREERIPVRITEHKQRLLELKEGDMEWVEVERWRQELHKDFEKALSDSKLPDSPDYEEANRFLLNARRQTYGI